MRLFLSAILLCVLAFPAFARESHEPRNAPTQAECDTFPISGCWYPDFAQAYSEAGGTPGIYKGTDKRSPIYKVEKGKRAYFPMAAAFSSSFWIYFNSDDGGTICLDVNLIEITAATQAGATNPGAITVVRGLGDFRNEADFSTLGTAFFSVTIASLDRDTTCLYSLPRGYYALIDVVSPAPLVGIVTAEAN